MFYCLSVLTFVCPHCGAKGRAYYDSERGTNGWGVMCRKCGKPFDDKGGGYFGEKMGELPDDAIFDSTDYDSPSHP